MKPEPLKEKIRSEYPEEQRKLIERLLHQLDEKQRKFDLRFFYFHDVKSAVEWLLEEIEREMRVERASLDMPRLNKDYIHGKIVAFEQTTILIKKAFKDVIE